MLSVVNVLSDNKAGENGIRLVGRVRFLDMQLPKHTSYHSEQLQIHVSLILSSLYAFMQWWLWLITLK